MSNSTLQRYRQYLNMLSPYRIPHKTQKRKQKISHHDLERPQMTSNDQKKPELTSKKSQMKMLKVSETKTKNV